MKVQPYSNLNQLVDDLVNAIDGHQRAALEQMAAGLQSVRPLPVVAPSVYFTDWLQTRIADRTGVCMGLQFLMASQAIDRVLSAGGDLTAGSESAWSGRRLAWNIFPKAKEFAGELGLQEPSTRDRFALARLVADQLDRYGHFRGEMILRWKDGKLQNPKEEAERWQRDLWRDLSKTISEMHPALRMAALQQAVAAGKAESVQALRELFPALIVVGTGSLDPLLVEALGLLEAAGCSVSVFVSLPSLDYLGELRRRGEYPLEAGQGDPEAIELSDGHPLLLSMGRQAVGVFQLLGRLDPQYAGWPVFQEVAPAKDGNPLLGQIQEDVRALRAVPTALTEDANDASLRVHACFGPRREMEVLRDELLRAFSEIPDLKPEEVLVLAPDLDVYAPLVPAVLEGVVHEAASGTERGTVLPVRLTERPPNDQPALAEALLAVVEMIHGGVFEASALIEMLHLRAVRARLGISDDAAALEKVRDWVAASGLTRQLGNAGSSVQLGTWRYALDRLIAGKWFGVESGAAYPADANACEDWTRFVLPVGDVLGGNLELRDTVIAWMAGLIEELGSWSAEATTDEWANRLDRLARRFLMKQEDDETLLESHWVVRALRETGCAEPLDAGSLLDWLRMELEQADRRTQLSGRITFGGFKRLQHIPCRVLAMVGMQDGAFPRQSRSPAWDLMRLAPRVWDRNERIEDRQAFLDAVLTASDRLIVTASTRNVRSGKMEPFSACVDELLRVAGQMGRKRESLVVEHPLQPFSRRYFMADTALPRPFDVLQQQLARELGGEPADSNGTGAGDSFWNGQPVGAGSANLLAEIRVHELEAFWKNPARGFLRALGVGEAIEEEDEETLDRVPLEIDGLQKWSIKNSILRSEIQKGELNHERARLFGARSMPPGFLGDHVWDDMMAAAEPVSKMVSRIWTGQREPLEVRIPVKGSGEVRVCGEVELGRAGEDEVVFEYRIGEYAKHAKNQLGPWIRALMAGAAGRQWPVCLMDETMKLPKMIAAVPQEQAAHLLAGLVAGYLEGLHRPLAYAPETSAAFWGALAEAGAEKALAKAVTVWEREASEQIQAGEGQEAAARMAWRGLDPFESPWIHDWQDWAQKVAGPLAEWFGKKAKTKKGPKS